jgi:hypothetical protein
MTTVRAKDFRKKAVSGAPDIEIEYDPARVQEFDTRGKCATKYQETWGQKVEIEIGGEPCVLYLELFSRSVAHVNLNKNIVKDR